tara:strand:- start:1881 stop:3086 length:1206 start_codon:yes stop_codon:yes gene_type:complete
MLMSELKMRALVREILISEAADATGGSFAKGMMTTLIPILSVESGYDFWKKALTNNVNSKTTSIEGTNIQVRILSKPMKILGQNSLRIVELPYEISKKTIEKVKNPKIRKSLSNAGIRLENQSFLNAIKSKLKDKKWYTRSYWYPLLGVKSPDGLAKAIKKMGGKEVWRKVRDAEYNRLLALLKEKKIAVIHTGALNPGTKERDAVDIGSETVVGLGKSALNWSGMLLDLLSVFPPTAAGAPIFQGLSEALKYADWAVKIQDGNWFEAAFAFISMVPFGSALEKASKGMTIVALKSVNANNINKLSKIASRLKEIILDFLGGDIENVLKDRLNAMVDDTKKSTLKTEIMSTNIYVVIEAIYLLFKAIGDQNLEALNRTKKIFKKIKNLGQKKWDGGKIAAI